MNNRERKGLSNRHPPTKLNLNPPTSNGRSLGNRPTTQRGGNDRIGNNHQNGNITPLRDSQQLNESPGRSLWSVKRLATNGRKSLLGKRFTKHYAAIGEKSDPNKGPSSTTSENAQKQLKPLYSSSPNYPSCSSLKFPPRPVAHLNPPRSAAHFNPPRSTNLNYLSSAYSNRPRATPSPQHPFAMDNLDGTAFFERGICDNTTWSVFKTGAKRGLASPGRKLGNKENSGLPQSTPLYPQPKVHNSRESAEQEKVVARKLYENVSEDASLDNTLGSRPLEGSDFGGSCNRILKENTSANRQLKKPQESVEELLRKMQQDLSTFSVSKKNKKLSVVQEEADESAKIIIRPIVNIDMKPNENSNAQHKIEKQNIENTPRRNSSSSEAELVNKMFTLRNEVHAIRENLMKNLNELTRKENEFDDLFEEFREFKSARSSLKTRDSVDNSTDDNTIRNVDIKENNSNILNLNSSNIKPNHETSNKNFDEYRLAYSYLKTPLKESVKKPPLKSKCYTPNSLKSCLKLQMESIYD